LATATGGHRASVSVSSELGQKATSFAGAINPGAAKICLDTGREGAWIHMHVDGFVAKELPGQCWEVRWSVGGKTFYTVHALSFWNCEDNFDNIDEQDEVYVLPAAPTTCAGLRVHINHLTFSLPFRCSVLCLALVPVSVVNPIVKGVLCTRTFILTLTTNGSLKYLTGDQENHAFRDGLQFSARFNEPSGVAFLPGHAKVLIADKGNHAIRLVTLSNGNVSTLTGNGSNGMRNGQDKQATFGLPLALL